MVIKDENITIAENEDEKFWMEVKEKTEGDLKMYEKMIKFNKGVVELCNRKLDEN